MIVCRKNMIGCPVKLTPMAIPKAVHMLNMIPARHSRAKKNAVMGRMNKYHAQCIHVDNAIAVIRKVTILTGIFLLLRDGHKKHTVSKTAIVKI